VANATPLPVSVKTRLGWDNADDLVSFGVSAQQAGADMICIHARTYQEPYKVAPQYAHVNALKEALTIPVIGNGGIQSLAEGRHYCHQLDGFYIGQATFGNPWVFAEKRPEKLMDRLPIILNHAAYLIEHKGDMVGTREIRKHLLSYVKGVPGIKPFKQRLVNVGSFDQIKDVLYEISEMENNYVKNNVTYEFA